MVNPLISIIVPVYNCEQYLPQCIDSILSQTYDAFELLLIDDGSVDRSGVICDEYARHDNRIRVIHKENAGVSSARNTGIEETCGEFITFVDADDLIVPNCLEELRRAMGEDADIAMCRFAHLGSEGVRDVSEALPNLVSLKENSTEYTQFVSRFLTFSNNIFGSACRVLWKRSAIGEVRFNPTIRISEDLLFLLQTFENAELFRSTENVGYYYRLNESSATKKYKKNYLQSQISLCRELEVLLGEVGAIHPVLKAYNTLLCYYVFSNEIKFRPKGWHKNIRDVRKSELYPYFKLKDGLKLHGRKQKIKFLIIWFLVKFRLV